MATNAALCLNGSAEGATAFLRWMEVCAKEFVKTFWRPIEAVANALLEHGTLTGGEIHQIMRSITQN